MEGTTPFKNMAEWYATRLQKAQEYVRAGRELEGYAIATNLLQYDDLDRLNAAGCHCVLATSTENALEHARKAVEVKQDGKEIEGIDRLLALRVGILTEAEMNEEVFGGREADNSLNN